MQIENSFSVGASPDEVFAFLLDVNRVVACVPGAELSEVVDPDTFRGRVRIKVGPVTVSYNGTAHVTARDDAARSATLQAEGRETTGSGSARATTTMSVAPDGDGSAVHFATDFTVVGRVAQFGRGIMEEVSRKLVGQMADCIRDRLEAQAGGGGPEPAASTSSPPLDGGAPKDTGAAGATASTPLAARQSTPPVATQQSTPSAATAPGPAASLAPRPQPATTRPAPQVRVGPEPTASAPLDAVALARSVAADRLRAIGPGRLTAIAAGLFAVFALSRLLRRRRA